ncbi:hypothetical protein ODZ84_01485 [Chryseobacterium fluminis]|uniref:hypothetical protein n=1 Tax=Chryseobacterium fluminis TaxID=2983606 RepID=UPI00225C0CAD|nr:hypothetical protein [Chryseobacterium sp. MMS21-Ot14]UZT98270.1 hypothetical protein ODZ84_01485 [Chryseobacterium sp. MMS21-Ot14]
MKHNLFLIGITMLSLTANAQVGIRTSSPMATLDIMAENRTGSMTNVDGFLLPRVDRQRAQSMISTPLSTIIYVNSIATGTATGTAVNITDTGYYYFNGTVWEKLNSGFSASSFSVNSTERTAFTVNDVSVTMIPGTSQSITVPVGGKALFINFMLGIDYTSNPAGSGAGYYEARLYIDGVQTDCYLRTQEYKSGGLNAQFTLSTVKPLTAGNHTLDIRMTRTANNGTTSGANMTCRPISMSFNASYIN